LKLNLKGHITMTAALAASALTFAGVAAGQDAHERSAGTALTVVALGAGQDAHERSARSSAHASIEYFRANERATLVQGGSTGALVAYVDGPQRSEPLVGAPGETIVAADDSGFDWGSAMVGASSALMLALLIGVSLMTVRRFRAGPLAH
jgi:hypothetical protein